MKRISLLILFFFLLFSCSGKTNGTDSQKASTPENTESIQKQKTPSEAQKIFPPQPQEDSLSYPNSIDHEWLDEDYQVPPWGGATDVTQIPEYIYTKLYWETTKNDWPTIEVLLDKYDLEYDEINAVNLNYAGMEAYDREDYLDAIALFRWGTLKDPSYVYPHYNLACSAALFLKKNIKLSPSVDNQDKYSSQYGYFWTVPFVILDELFSHLSVTIFLEKDYINKIQQDEDLTILHSMKRYQNFLEFSQNGDIWPFYGFFSENVVPSEISNYYSILLDGRCYGDCFEPSFFTNSGIFIEDGFLSFFSIISETGELEKNVKTTNKIFSKIVEDRTITDLWKMIVLDFGYFPWWDTSYDMFWDYILNENYSISCGLSGGSHISSIGNSLIAESMTELRTPNETAFWPLTGFKLITDSFPKPQLEGYHALVLPNGEKRQRTNMNQYWKAIFE